MTRNMNQQTLAVRTLFTDSTQIWCNLRQIAVAGRGRPRAIFISHYEFLTKNLDQGVTHEPTFSVQNMARRRCPSERRRPVQTSSRDSFNGSFSILVLLLEIQDTGGWYKRMVTPTLGKSFFLACKGPSSYSILPRSKTNLQPEACPWFVSNLFQHSF